MCKFSNMRCMYFLSLYFAVRDVQCFASRGASSGFQEYFFELPASQQPFSGRSCKIMFHSFSVFACFYFFTITFYLRIFILQLIICGEALSHCVNYTLRDIITLTPSAGKKITLLRDCKKQFLSLLFLHLL